MTVMNVLDIPLAACPDYIYLAIGCSQKWHKPEKRQPQQYPPQIAALPGSKLCILIDPELEAPPHAVQLLWPGTIEIDGSMTGIYNINPTLTFVVIRRNFEWPETTLMKRLMQSRLIVQDYSGAIIDRYYPRDRALLGRVLFDFTYDDGGCFIDFDKIRILQRADGSFIQPQYEPIAATIDAMTPEQAKAVVKMRVDTMSYVQRLYRIQSGTEPYRDWCTTDVVAKRAAPVFFAYDIAPATDNATLERLMLAVFADFSHAAGDMLVESEALDTIRNADKGYETALRILRDILAP
jgi:hypothetical protein